MLPSARDEVLPRAPGGTARRAWRRRCPARQRRAFRAVGVVRSARRRAASPRDWLTDSEKHSRTRPRCGRRRSSPIRSAGLEEAGDVFGRDRVARLRPPILAGIAKVRDDCCYAFGAGVFQGPDKEQQTVIWALFCVAIQGVDHEHILATHLGERSDLVFAILEPALLVRAEDQLEMLCDSLAVILCAPDRKQREPYHVALHRYQQSEPRHEEHLDLAQSAVVAFVI